MVQRIAEADATVDDAETATHEVGLGTASSSEKSG